jgi:hypothetical protein
VLTHQHFNMRETQRAFPSQIVLPFDPSEWEVLTAEVLNSGKFMSTTWTRVFNGKRWFIVFAKGDVAVTVYDGTPERRLLGPEIVTGGPFFDKVEQVNRVLMDGEASGS